MTRPKVTIAFAVTGLTGALNAALEMASRLRREGYAITFLCPSAAARDPVERAGFAFVSLPPVNFRFQDATGRMPTAESWRRRARYHFGHRGRLHTETRRVLALDAFDEVLGRLDADHLIVSVELHEIVLLAHARSLPTTLLSTWFSNRTGPTLPPLRSATVPGTGPRGSVPALTLAWLVDRARTRARRLLDLVRLRHYRAWALERLAREVGLARGLRPSSFPPLFDYTELPLATVTMRELDFPHAPHPNVSYIGPMVFMQGREHPDDVLERLLGEAEREGRRILYCSVGSFRDGDARFLRRVMQAVESEPDWLLILSLGGNLRTEALGGVPANVHPFDWVAQPAVLARADCSINHGGGHSINECVRFGVPMLVYSGKRYDQNGCAARVQYHGLGLMRDKDRDGAHEIRQQIRRVLDDERFADRARHFRTVAEAYAARPLGPALFDRLENRKSVLPGSVP